MFKSNEMSEENQDQNNENQNNPNNLLDTMINLVDKDEIHSIIDCQRLM